MAMTSLSPVSNPILSTLLAPPSASKIHVLHRKALLWNIAQKICAIAALLLMSAVSYSMMLGASLPISATLLGMLGSAALIALSSFAGNHFKIAAQSASMQNDILRCYRAIAHWTSADITSFFEHHQLPL